jgi:hypothetical protein
VVGGECPKGGNLPAGLAVVNCLANGPPGKPLRVFLAQASSGFAGPPSEEDLQETRYFLETPTEARVVSQSMRSVQPELV